MISTGEEDPKSLLRPARRTSSNYQRNGRNEMLFKQPVQPPITIEKGREDTSQVVFDPVVSEEHLAYFEVAHSRA